jgi:hypothetical protein
MTARSIPDSLSLVGTRRPCLQAGMRSTMLSAAGAGFDVGFGVFTVVSTETFVIDQPFSNPSPPPPYPSFLFVEESYITTQASIPEKVSLV